MTGLGSPVLADVPAVRTALGIAWLPDPRAALVVQAATYMANCGERADSSPNLSGRSQR
jgi:hypothetical protein